MVAARGVFNLGCSMRESPIVISLFEIFYLQHEGFSSLTREQTQALCIERADCSHWTTREVLEIKFLRVIYLLVRIENKIGLDLQWRFSREKKARLP